MSRYVLQSVNRTYTGTKVIYRKKQVKKCFLMLKQKLKIRDANTKIIQ